MANMAEFWK